MSSFIRSVHREIAVHKFMSIVKREAQKQRVVILYGDAGPSDRSGWRKWMAEPEFREAVIARCCRVPRIYKFGFQSPCEYDGWIFAAYVREDKRPWK